MATLSKGKTFTNGELVTPEKIHQLVDSATVANITNADIAANAAIADTKLATISTAGKVLPAAVQGTAVITTDSRLSDARTPISHTHDDRYYTETEVNSLLAGKQASGSYAPATGIAPSAITGTAVITTDSRLVPAGAVMPFAMNSAPSGWLQANGDLVSRSTYSALFSAIGTTYGSGDGSTTFNLPDLRGYFLRGSGTNIDGTASGNFGSKQSDDVKPHSHPVSWAFGTCVLSVQEIQGGRSTGSATTVTDINVSTGFPSASIAIQTNLGTETRPKNIAMMYCIKT
jgi:microcystin-dependent protein